MHSISKQTHKTVKAFCLSCFLSISCFSTDLKHDALSQKLYEDQYFLKLLHYRHGKSEIDSANFFVTPNGKEDPKEELVGSIDALLKGEKNFLCRFPLRTLYLEQKLPTLSQKRVDYPCEELESYLANMQPNFLAVIFPAGHINSPASMYGHSFLRIGENAQTPLVSNAINFAAKTAETNGFIFAYKGLFGGYEGHYSILPYYEKIKEYSNLEQRDIWEYEIAYTPDEVYKVALHAYELRDAFSYYYFILQNCSYNLLWLIEIARDDLDLVGQFDVFAPPLDTIKILKEYNLIKSSHFRHSKRLKMKQILSEMGDTSEISDFLSSPDAHLQEKLSDADKMRYLDFKIEYYQYLRRKNEIEQKEYIKNYMNLLRKRSGFKQVSSYEVKPKKDPLFSHGSSRASLFYESKKTLGFAIKPVYSDIYDVLDGHLPGAYIDFLHLSLKKNEKALFVDKLNLLNIRSYSPIDKVFKPISWGIEAGYERFKSFDGYVKISPQFGYTFGNDKHFLYAVLGSNAYLKNANSFISISPRLGLVLNDFTDLKLGATSSYNRYDNGLENTMAELFVTKKLGTTLSLNLRYMYDDLKNDKHSGRFALFYYF